MNVFDLVENAVADGESLAAPDDRVGGETGDPEGERDEIAQGQQPEVGKDLVIGEDFSAGGHGEGEAKKKGHGEKPEAERADAAGDHVEYGPCEAMGEEQAGISRWTGVAHSAQPAQLVIYKASPGVRRGAGLDNFSAESDCIAGLRDARAELVVVGEVIDKEGEPTDAIEGFATDGEGGTKSVVHAAFNPFR